MDVATLRMKYRAVSGALSERSRRLWAASEAMALGHGGVALVERATGISRSTVTRGIREVEAGKSDELPPERARRPGGGRKRATEKDTSLLDDLDALVEPTTRGDPEGPLRWTSKSLRHLADELQALGHDVSYALVGRLLKESGYSLQANQKTREGAQHEDRDAQFRYIARCVRRCLREGAPAISVDTKKKELVGDFKNAGREWRPKGNPEPVRVHDFLIPEQGKAIPYGVYDLSRDEGWVSVGIDHDTAAFAVNAVRQWWKHMGRLAYPNADSLLITADAGGSNGPKVRLWKWELQRFANRTGLSITVCHFPPGTSKWNKIEHRLFSHIAMNWRGKPLVSLATIVSLIGSTTSSSGLRIRSQIDHGSYPLGVPVTDAQMATVRVQPHRFHGDWNYTIR
ncbi:MAG: ISAzo13 family transposase, partial [Gemmatimonadetes bacterium]|nr:ISAzo13 family transposase [Gemmatimonadota bacterium]